MRPVRSVSAALLGSLTAAIALAGTSPVAYGSGPAAHAPRWRATVPPDEKPLPPPGDEYNRGYRAGYAQGTHDGYQSCTPRPLPLQQSTTAYTNGYTAGYGAGFRSICNIL